MNILYTCLSRSWGETEQYTAQVIKNLLAKDIDVELVCYPESRLHIECNNLSLMIHPFPVKGYFSFYQILKLAALISKRKYKIIHSQTSKDLWLVSPAIRLLKRKVPIVLTKHILSAIDKKDKAHGWIYKKVTNAIAVSNVVKENLLQTCPISENKILIIPNFVDTSVFYIDEVKKQIIKKEFNLEEKDFIISIVCKEKGINAYKSLFDNLTEAFKNNKNIKFIFLGDSYRGEEHFSEALRDFCIKNNYKNVIFPGIKFNLNELLQFSDIFIYNSAEESFSTRVIEAMSCGNIIVCNKQSGINGIIENEKNGFVIDELQSDLIIKKIKELIVNKELYESIQQNGKESVKNNFDMNLHTDKLLNLYKELII